MKKLKKKNGDEILDLISEDEILDLISENDYLSFISILSELSSLEIDSIWDKDEQLGQILTDSISLYKELLELKEQFFWAHERRFNK